VKSVGDLWLDSFLNETGLQTINAMRPEPPKRLPIPRIFKLPQRGKMAFPAHQSRFVRLKFFLPT
jgi:hypothetical protein